MNFHHIHFSNDEHVINSSLLFSIITTQQNVVIYHNAFALFIAAQTVLLLGPELSLVVGKPSGIVSVN